MSQQQPAGPNTTIYVRNINYNTSTKTLGDEFAKIGKVTTARIITRRFRNTEYSQGFGFVTFDTPDAMNNAIQQNRKIVLEGRTLIIREARPPVPRKRDTLFVRHIPAGASPDDLKALFKDYKPAEAKIVKFDNDKIPGFGFVRFETEENRTNAFKNSNNLQLKDVKIEVHYAWRPYNLPKNGGKKTYGRRRAPRQNQTTAPQPANQ